MKDLINKVDSVCLTTDCWTSRSNEGYIAVTAYFVNSLFLIQYSWSVAKSLKAFKNKFK